MENTENLPGVYKSPDSGLNSEEIRQRVAEGKVNSAAKTATRTYSDIIKGNVFTYFNLIFAVLAALLIIVGSFKDLTFLGVIFFNTIIGIAQEIRSKQALDKLKIISDPKAVVIRNGTEQTVPVEELVLDDVIVLTAGSQIPADAIVISGSCHVNESLITGESDEVLKKNGYELLSGSFVVSGSCRAQLTKVGDDSYVSQLTKKATMDERKEESEMIRALDKLVKIVGVIIIPIGLTLFIQQMFFVHSGFRDSVTGMVAAVIGMIPEGLYLLASVALVVSVMRLARQNVLVRSMKCIETLARVDVLCVDKTGTITETTMKVSRLVPENGSDAECVRSLLGCMVSGMDNDNITMTALKEYFKNDSETKPDKIIPFSSQYKYSGCVISGQSYVLGAPEFVLRSQYDKYKETVDKFSSQGYRVLAFAKYAGEADGKALTENTEILGFVLMENPIRSSAKETFEYFDAQGVEVKVISGDNPVTVSRIAAEAGIKGADKYVDATTLTSDQAILDACIHYNVFGRVVPEQKRQFVMALKALGKTVGMTGDGVNDVLALKEADCSIAMASGSDAASQVSQLVLVDSDFSKMPSVVGEGRRVVNNIQRTAGMFLVKNIFSLLLALFSMVVVNGYPMDPSQVSLVAMFTIGTPAFFLSLEPNKNLIKGRFLTNVFKKAIPAGLTDFLVVAGLVMLCDLLGVDEQSISTASTILVSLVGFMVLFKVSQPMNTFHWVLFGVMLAGWVGCAIFLEPIFAMRLWSLKCLFVLIIFALATEPLLRGLSAAIEFIFGKFASFRKRKSV